MEDKQLVSLLLNFPSEGLTQAINCYGGSAKWIALKIIGTGHDSDVEECVSDAFVRLWQNIQHYDATAGVPLKSYLFGIVRHTALDYRRKMQQTEPFLPLEENDLQIDVDFTDEIAREINQKILQESIDDLKEPDREIFIRRYFLGERILSIAATLSLNEKMVENKLYRGKKKLKCALIERGIIL